MSVVEEVLAGFLPKMMRLAPHQKDAAIIVAQGLRLLSLVQAHQLRVAAMVPLCLQSVEYAKLAQDPNTLSASFNGLAVAYKYAQQPEHAFKAYQEAIYYSDQASPLFRSRVYAGAGAAFAVHQRTKEADFYLHYAYDNFPDHPKEDPNFLSADNGIYMLAYYEGISYLEMGQPERAAQAFESYKKHPSGASVPERNRLEILNHLGRAAILAGDLDTYAACLEEGISGALPLKSKKRFDEALNIYRREMPKSWRLEPQMKPLIEHYQLTAEVE